MSAVGGFKYTYQITGQTQGVGIGDWSQDTTITLANGTTQQVYTNFAGEPLLSALTDTTDAVNPKLNGVIWNTFFAYDLQGRLLFTAEPSTKVQPNPSNPSLLSLAGSNQGLIDGTDYHTTTGTNGGRGRLRRGHLRRTRPTGIHQGDPGLLPVFEPDRRLHPSRVGRHGLLGRDFERQRSQRQKHPFRLQHYRR